MQNKILNFVIDRTQVLNSTFTYSHLSNSRGGWNKRGGGAKVVKSLNVEGGIFWKKIVHNYNKRGGWKKSKKSINVEGGFFFKINKRDSTFFREMRVTLII